MEGCLTFQLGGGCFSDGGASFLSAGGALPGGIGFDGGGVKKTVGSGGGPPMPYTLWETLGMRG